MITLPLTPQRYGESPLKSVSKGSFLGSLVFNLCLLSLSGFFLWKVAEHRDLYLQTKQELLQKISKIRDLEKKQHVLFQSDQGKRVTAKLTRPYQETEFTHFLLHQAKSVSCAIEINHHPSEVLSEIFAKFPFHLSLKCLADSDFFSFVDALIKKAQNMLVIDNLAIERVQEFSDDLFEKALHSKDLWLFDGDISFDLFTTSSRRK